MKEHRFYILLTALTLLLFATPVMRGFETFATPILTRIVLTTTFVLMLISAVYAVARTQFVMKLSIVLATPLVVLELITAFYDNEQLLLINYVVSTVFLTFVIVTIVKFLFTTIQVNGNTICAAVCVYLMLGILASMVFSIVVIIEPESFYHNALFSSEDRAAILRFEGEQSTESLYFSFVTLTTLGFGDITPKTPAAKMLVAFEAVVGQLFLTVLIARLVGMHITSSTVRANERKK